MKQTDIQSIETVLALHGTFDTTMEAVRYVFKNFGCKYKEAIAIVSQLQEEGKLDIIHNFTYSETESREVYIYNGHRNGDRATCVVVE